MRGSSLLLTCEHGGNRVPSAYRRYFSGKSAKAALAAHRGYDAGALALARTLAIRLGVPLHGSTVSRLLIDLNRSPGNRNLFSPFVTRLDDAQRAKLIDDYLLPHRRNVEASIDALMKDGRPVLHVAVHSFTPRLRGVTRNADVGLLYDEARWRERELAQRWREHLLDLDPALRVRRNYPYRGSDDGLTRHLRRRYPATAYLGIELELNQATLARRARAITSTVVESLKRLLDPRPVDRSSARSRTARRSRPRYG